MWSVECVRGWSVCGVCEGVRCVWSVECVRGWGVCGMCEGVGCVFGCHVNLMYHEGELFRICTCFF